MHLNLELAQLWYFVPPFVAGRASYSERDSKLLASAKKVDRFLCLHSAIVRCLTCKVKPSLQRLLLTIRVSGLTIAATVRRGSIPKDKGSQVRTLRLVIKGGGTKAPPSR